MVPLELRNALYRLFVECLGDPAREAALDGLAGDEAYLKDRLARYKAVLRARPSGTLAVAQALFNQGLFFDCHEFLEGPWKAASGPWKPAYQGLIQIAAGLHKLELDPNARAGAAELIEKGLQKLRDSRALSPETLAHLARHLEPCLLQINAGTFELAAVPPLRFERP